MINEGSVEDWLAGRRLEHDPGVAGSSSYRTSFNSLVMLANSQLVFPPTVGVFKNIMFIEIFIS